MDAATGATLDTGGWLTLTRQGLEPCKMHRASLGALTPHNRLVMERSGITRVDADPDKIVVRFTLTIYPYSLGNYLFYLYKFAYRFNKFFTFFKGNIMQNPRVK